MVQKPFAIGLRIEHLQEEVNKSRYHEFFNHKAMDSASYNLNVRTPDNRGVFTFCMCPGGEVIMSSSSKNEIVVNGMSNYMRNNTNANSAVLVGINPMDFKSNDVLSGFEFQKEIEQNAFKLVGGKYIAPVQTVGSFLNVSDNIVKQVVPSCRNGYTLVDLKKILPNYVVNNLIYSLPKLGSQMSCFNNKNAVLTGVETRTSSPVKIIRNEKLQTNIKGLYGAGEGAGFAGGIMSAACDGIKIARLIYNV